MICTCNRVTNPGGKWVSGNCRLCFLRLGGIVDRLPIPVRPAEPSRPKQVCVHLGEPTGDTVGCPPCGPQVALKLFACAVHGTCTAGRRVNGQACCDAKCHERQFRPVIGELDKVGQLEVTAEGIGDHIGALTVAAGWEVENPGKRVRIVAKSAIVPWLELFDVDVTTEADSIPHVWIAGNRTSGQHFIEAVASCKSRAMPKAKPASALDSEWAEQFRGCIVLAPFSRGSGRNWLASHWLTLEDALRKRGIECVAIGSAGESTRLAAFQGARLAGESPGRIAALMQASACVVANESGMAHLAGALRVPCIVLAAQLDGQAIHGFWPRTTVLQAPLACSRCHWTGPDFRPACHSVCASLQAIMPADVLAALEPYIGNRYPWMSDRLRAMLAKLNLILPAVAGKHQFVDRGVSFAKFLDILSRKAGPVLMVETGCQRQVDDPGAGMSTTIFGTYLADRNDGSRLISLDCDPAHVALARSLPVCELGTVEVVETDSRPWLRVWNGGLIDAAYLDSADCWVLGHQDVSLEEAMAVLPLLSRDAPLLADDTWREGDGFAGKGGKAIPYLQSQGWRVIHAGYQTLLTR